MRTLIVEPTAIAQWHALVKDAQTAYTVKIDEGVESYLVFLLMRFSDHPELVSGILALEYLKGMQSLSQIKQQQLQEVGDKCLLFAGLFPAHNERRRVPMEYFVNLGRIAYGHLALHSRQENMGLFEALCKQFVTLMDILLAIREMAYSMAGLTPLQVEELWHQTQSHWAFENLKQITHGIPVDVNSSKKH